MEDNRKKISIRQVATALLAIGFLEGFVIGFIVFLNPLKRALDGVLVQNYLHFRMFRLIALIFQRPFFDWLLFAVVLALLSTGSGMIIFLFTRSSAKRRGEGNGKNVWVMLASLRWLRIAGFFCLFLLLIVNGVVAFYSRDTVHPRPDVVLIVIDALRPDHMSSYGYAKNTTPAIDRLAREATLFKQAVVVFPRTTPSAVSIMTGLYPHTHGTRSLYVTGDMYETPGNNNLAEILLNENYRTAAFLDQRLLHPNSGLQQGFMTYRNLENDAEVTRQAVSWLERGKDDPRPFFLLLWYLAPHWPYNPLQKDLDLFSADPAYDLSLLFLRGKDPNQRCFSRLYTPEEMGLLISAYDAEIRQSDTAVGGILNYLRGKGLYQDTLIIVTADHGESLGEHDYYFDHGEYYYDTDALVPLIIKRPEQTGGVVVSYQVRSIDIFPTLLGVLGIRAPSEGVDLFSYGAGKPGGADGLIAFGENDYSMFPNNPKRYLKGIAGKWRMVRTGRWKLILIPHPGENIFEFYDLADDPAETNNLINDPAYRARIEELKKKLFGWIKEGDLRNTDAPQREEIAPSARKRLQSLGYL